MASKSSVLHNAKNVRQMYNIGSVNPIVHYALVFGHKKTRRTVLKYLAAHPSNIMPFSWDFVNNIPVLGQIKAGVHLCLPNQKEEAEKALTKSNQSTVILTAAIVGKILGGNPGVHRAVTIAQENISTAVDSNGTEVRGVAKILFHPNNPDSWIDGACTVIDEVVPEMDLRGRFVNHSNRTTDPAIQAD